MKIMTKTKKTTKPKKPSTSAKRSSTSQGKKSKKIEIHSSDPSNSRKSRVSGRSTSIDLINVNFEDEITFVVDKLEDSKKKNIIVSIPSGSDLLVSTVSLELLAEVADREGKKIVIVTDDDSGRTLAKTVGVTVRNLISEVTKDVWEEAVEDAKKRSIDMENRREWAKDFDEEGGIMPVASVKAGKPVISTDRPSRPSAARVREMVQSGSKSVNLGDFEMTIDSTPIGESKESSEDMSSQLKPEVKKVKSSKMGKKVGGKSFIGRDFSNFKIEGMGKDEKADLEKMVKPLSELNKSEKIKRDPIVPQQARDSRVAVGVKPLKDRRPKKKVIDFSKIKAFITGPGKGKKIAIIIGILLLLGVGGVYGASRIIPEAVVTLEISSIPVEYEGTITADIGEDGIDEDGLVIPAKIEEVDKNGSDSTATTGTESRGEKATGTVLVFNKYIEEEIVLNAGTIIRNGSLNFVLQNSVVLDPVTLENPATMGESDITAQEIGSEYNLSSGTQFSVADYDIGNVYATNTESFGGGTSEDYRVVTASDINNVVEGIQETIEDEAEGDLEREGENSRWELVSDSIEHELAEDPTSSAPVGAEADNIDVSIELESKGIYYDKNKLDELVGDLLLEDFDGQIEEIEISDNVDQTITVDSYDMDEGTVTLSVSVSGYVMPQLDEDKIKEELAGKSWTDGIKYLENMDYVSEEYELKYFPEWMPEFLWRMPSGTGKIRVKVDNVTPEESEEDEGSEEEPSSSEDSEES